MNETDLWSNDAQSEHLPSLWNLIKIRYKMNKSNSIWLSTWSIRLTKYRKQQIITRPWFYDLMFTHQQRMLHKQECKENTQALIEKDSS